MSYCLSLTMSTQFNAIVQTHIFDNRKNFDLEIAYALLRCRDIAIIVRIIPLRVLNMENRLASVCKDGINITFLILEALLMEALLIDTPLHLVNNRRWYPPRSLVQ